MDKKLLIDEYLQGRHPVEGEPWELPTEGELDRDEALYDALLEERKKTPLHRGREWGWVYAAAAVLVAVITLFTWKSQTQEPLPPSVEKTAEVVVPENATHAPLNKDTSLLPSGHVLMPIRTRPYSNKHVCRSETPREALAETTQKDDSVIPSTAADSLYYYLTQLEAEMGDCRDSACFAQLGELMRADERIKALVQKIIHKQVETAYEEEYLVDTTTHYVPL